MRLSYAIVFVSDMNRSVAFYRDVVGLPLKFQTPGWTEFATDGATLALHAAERAEAPRSDKAAAGTCRPGLSVQDLDAFHQRMVTHRVPCLQEPRETFGVRLARYLDPDGLELSVSEAKGGPLAAG